MCRKNHIFLVLPGLMLTAGISCVKSSFLDKKPSTNLVVPSSLGDFQALLDNTVVMTPTPVLGEISADNFYMPSSFWQGIDAKEHNAYTWATDIYAGQQTVDDWDAPYKQVFYANVVLAGLPAIKVDNTNRNLWNSLEGCALFIRAYAFHNLAQVFAPVYDSSRSSSDLGIPLRLDPDINSVSVRATVERTYQQILSDLRKAVPLLPVTVQKDSLNRPSRPAAYALLARVYLSMGAYAEARTYADSCLRLYSTLINFDAMGSQRNSSFPFGTNPKNKEALYQSNILSSTGAMVALFYPNCIVDSLLYQSYDSNDLRKTVFYRLNMQGLPNMKAGLSGSVYPFTGMATDEVYLVRAEGAAMMGDKDAAMNDLNTLLYNCYKDSAYSPRTAATAAAALQLIRQERRKELPFRGLRWSDLRRYNREGAGINLVRLVDGRNTLQAGSLRWVLPIPPDVIATNPNMPQNPR